MDTIPTGSDAPPTGFRDIPLPVGESPTHSCILQPRLRGAPTEVHLTCTKVCVTATAVYIVRPGRGVIALTGRVMYTGTAVSHTAG
jgi:hypothetical protein